MKEYIDKALATLTKVAWQPRKRTPVKVLVDGQVVVTRSGKSAWPSTGAAKCAIRNHFGSSLRSVRDGFGSLPWDERKVFVEAFFKALWKDERIKIVPLNGPAPSNCTSIPTYQDRIMG